MASGVNAEAIVRGAEASGVEFLAASAVEVWQEVSSSAYDMLNVFNKLLFDTQQYLALVNDTTNGRIKVRALNAKLRGTASNVTMNDITDIFKEYEKVKKDAKERSHWRELIEQELLLVQAEVDKFNAALVGARGKQLKLLYITEENSAYAVANTTDLLSAEHSSRSLMAWSLRFRADSEKLQALVEQDKATSAFANFDADNGGEADAKALSAAYNEAIRRWDTYSGILFWQDTHGEWQGPYNVSSRGVLTEGYAAGLIAILTQIQQGLKSALFSPYDREINIGKLLDDYVVNVNSLSGRFAGDIEFFDAEEGDIALAVKSVSAGIAGWQQFITLATEIAQLGNDYNAIRNACINAFSSDVNRAHALAVKGVDKMSQKRIDQMKQLLPKEVIIAWNL